MELYGVHAWFQEGEKVRVQTAVSLPDCMIRMLCKFYQITEGEVELACDGLQALRYVSRMEVTIEAKAPQFDLLAATRRVFRKCPVTVKFRHIKGHQDDNFYADLDEWARLNIDMDDGAKEHWLRCKDSCTRQQYIFGEPWPFWGGRMESNERGARDYCGPH